MQQLFAGDRVQVVRLTRETREDRSPYVGRNGVLVQRLNVPWTPELGALWRVRFFSGGEAVFAESELAVVEEDGTLLEPDLGALKESWGKAPRTVTLPFKRRFGAGSASAPALVAAIAFAIAGVLLLWTGVAQGDWRAGAAGGVLVALGLGSAAVLVS